MTNEEAIEKLKANIEADENVMKLFGLKNRPDFKLDILALESAINALEKQIPKRPKDVVFSPFAGKCISCGELVTAYDKYCHNCGQRLDWSEE